MEEIRLTSWDEKGLVNNGINYLSTGAVFLPSTVHLVNLPLRSLDSTICKSHYSPCSLRVKEMMILQANIQGSQELITHTDILLVDAQEVVSVCISWRVWPTSILSWFGDQQCFKKYLLRCVSNCWNMFQTYFPNRATKQTPLFWLVNGDPYKVFYLFKETLCKWAL